MVEPFIGEISMVAFTFAPRGWAFCDGQLLAISQNTALFSLIGTTYGGDGRTTFALPDLRGRVPLHMGNGPGLTSRPEGQKGGSETVTLTVSQMPAHNHQANASSTTSDKPGPINNFWGGEASGATAVYSDQTPDGTMNPNALSHAGGSQPHYNLQPYLVIAFVIALQGIFPPRS